MTASTGSGDGTLGLNLVDNDTIVDTSNRKLVGTGTNTDGSFTGQVFTIDRTAPTVTAVAPTENANNVAVGTNVDATFSEDMNASTITTGPSSGTFTLRQGSSSGTIVGSGSGLQCVNQDGHA